ncbi:cathelicidin-B1-like isoform X2 [Prinia subflava]|uniref:cathelicidin-B1-like isoform X2 n=1 Tax=Prinia subflava TaxID=208062 RepID=UPI002FE38476
MWCRRILSMERKGPGWSWNVPGPGVGLCCRAVTDTFLLGTSSPWNAHGSSHKSAAGPVGSRIRDPGAGMGPCRALPPLLLLLGLGLAGASTPGPRDGATVGWDGATAGGDGTTAASPGLLSYEDAVAAAVEVLNTRAGNPYVLRLREAQPRPGWPSDLQSRQELSFTLEETTCRAPGTATGDCKSRWLGALTWCQGSVFLEGQQPTVELSCEKGPATFGPIWKSKIKDFFGKIKQRFRGFFQCGRIWIRDRLNIKAPKP